MSTELRLISSVWVYRVCLVLEQFLDDVPLLERELLYRCNAH